MPRDSHILRNPEFWTATSTKSITNVFHNETETKLQLKYILCVFCSKIWKERSLQRIKQQLPAIHVLSEAKQNQKYLE